MSNFILDKINNIFIQTGINIVLYMALLIKINKDVFKKN